MLSPQCHMIPNTMGVLDTGFQCLLDQKKTYSSLSYTPQGQYLCGLVSPGGLIQGELQ